MKQLRKRNCLVVTQTKDLTGSRYQRQGFRIRSALFYLRRLQSSGYFLCLLLRIAFTLGFFSVRFAVINLQQDTISCISLRISSASAMTHCAQTRKRASICG